MIRPSVWIAAGLGMLCCTATAAAQDDVATVRKAIDGQNRAWEAATKKSDAAAIAQIFADSGVEVGLRVGETWKGRAAIEAQYKVWYAQVPRATDAVVETEQVIVDGPTAVEYGHYQFTYPPKDGKPQVQGGKYVVIWRKQSDGAWRIVMDTGVPPVQ